LIRSPVVPIGIGAVDAQYFDASERGKPPKSGCGRMYSRSAIILNRPNQRRHARQAASAKLHMRAEWFELADSALPNDPRDTVRDQATIPGLDQQIEHRLIAGPVAKALRHGRGERGGGVRDANVCDMIPRVAMACWFSAT